VDPVIRGLGEEREIQAILITRWEVTLVAALSDRDQDRLEA